MADIYLATYFDRGLLVIVCAHHKWVPMTVRNVLGLPKLHENIDTQTLSNPLGLIDPQALMDERKAQVQRLVNRFIATLIQRMQIRRQIVQQIIYVGDCNLGFANDAVFPDFLMHDECFLTLLASLAEPRTERMRLLMSANETVVTAAKLHIDDTLVSKMIVVDTADFRAAFVALYQSLRQQAGVPDATLVTVPLDPNEKVLAEAEWDLFDAESNVPSESVVDVKEKGMGSVITRLHQSSERYKLDDAMSVMSLKSLATAVSSLPGNNDTESQLIRESSQHQTTFQRSTTPPSPHSSSCCSFMWGVKIHTTETAPNTGTESSQMLKK